MENKINIFWKNATPEEKNKFKRLVKRINQYGGIIITHDKINFNVTYNKHTDKWMVNEKLFSVQPFVKNIYGVTNYQLKTSYFKSSPEPTNRSIQFTYQNENGKTQRMYTYQTDLPSIELSDVENIIKCPLHNFYNSCYMDSAIYCLFLIPNPITNMMLASYIKKKPTKYQCPISTIQSIVTYLSDFIVPYIRGYYDRRLVYLSKPFEVGPLRNIVTKSFRDYLSMCHPIGKNKNYFLTAMRDPKVFINYLFLITDAFKYQLYEIDKYTIYIFTDTYTINDILNKLNILKTINFINTSNKESKSKYFLCDDYYISFKNIKEKQIIETIKLPANSKINLNEYFKSLTKYSLEVTRFDDKSNEVIIDINSKSKSEKKKFIGKYIYKKKKFNGDLLIILIEPEGAWDAGSAFERRKSISIIPSLTLTHIDTYELVSICVNVGACHYVAYLKIKNSWYFYNDLGDDMVKLNSYDDMLKNRNREAQCMGVLYFYHKI